MNCIWWVEVRSNIRWWRTGNWNLRLMVQIYRSSAFCCIVVRQSTTVLNPWELLFSLFVSLLSQATLTLIRNIHGITPTLEICVFNPVSTKSNWSISSCWSLKLYVKLRRFFWLRSAPQRHLHLSIRPSRLAFQLFLKTFMERNTYFKKPAHFNAAPLSMPGGMENANGAPPSQIESVIKNANCSIQHNRS